MNVSDIATKALKNLGIIAAGESAEASELADAVDALQGLLAQWATSRLYVYKAQILKLHLTKGADTYLIGKIEGDCCEYAVTCCGDVLDRPDLKAEIAQISDRAWLDENEITLVRDLNNTASHAKVWYQADAPNWAFHVRETGHELKIKAYTLPFDLCAHDELHLPHSYERPLILSLALELAPMFGVEPSITLVTNQRNAIAMLKSSNVVPMCAKNDLPVGVRYDCY